MALPLCCCLTSLHAASSGPVGSSDLHSCCHASAKTATTDKKPCPHCAQKQHKNVPAKEMKVAKARELQHPVWPGTHAPLPDHHSKLSPATYFQRLESPPQPSSSPARLALLGLRRC